MTTNLYMHKQYVDSTHGDCFGESDVFETYTDKPGELFRSCQREYGRCTSAVYIDTADGTKKVGWVFQKRMLYEGSRTRYPEDYYIREVWVTLHTAPPTRTTAHHLHYLD